MLVVFPKDTSIARHNIADKKIQKDFADNKNVYAQANKTSQKKLPRAS